MRKLVAEFCSMIFSEGTALYSGVGRALRSVRLGRTLYSGVGRALRSVGLGTALYKLELPVVTLAP